VAVPGFIVHFPLEATQRKQNIEYVFKEGGIAMTADAVTFELLRLATIKIF
jgi:hypothetical protein